MYNVCSLFSLSLLLRCEIPLGRGYLYHLYISIIIPGMQNLLSIGSFSNLDRKNKEKRREYLRALYHVLQGIKSKIQ